MAIIFIFIRLVFVITPFKSVLIGAFWVCRKIYGCSIIMAIKLDKSVFFLTPLFHQALISWHLRSFGLRNFFVSTRNVILCETFIGGDAQSTPLSYFPKIIVTISSAENDWLVQQNTGILVLSLYGEPSGPSNFSVSLASEFL